jgi:CheY-like chemotaxis protein
VEGITKLLSRTLGEDVPIILNLSEDVWPIIADPVQLESTLTNLATNARDAMPQGGMLKITTSNSHLDANDASNNNDGLSGDYVVIKVSDMGNGMSPEVLARIFEPFYTTKEQGKGTGLGLAMVFGFVKQSGGHINVESKIGSGTIFSLYMPRATVNVVTIAQTAGVTVNIAKHETILVVEDNADVRQIVTHHLVGLGYHVFEVSNAAKALELLTFGDKVDLLFTDIVMPGKLNGLDLAREAKERWPNLKIILTSGFPETKLNDPGAEVRGIRLLNKPYRKADLASLIRETLDGVALENQSSVRAQAKTDTPVF